MALVRWQPDRPGQTIARSPREDLECFFEELFGPRTWGTQRVTTGFAPRVDLRDTPESFVLRAELPGVERDDLDLTITADVVALKGTRKDPREGEADCYVCRESAAGSFERVVPLPQSVDSERAEARLANGVLTVTLPKAQPRKAIRISVG